MISSAELRGPTSSRAAAGHPIDGNGEALGEPPSESCVSHGVIDAAQRICTTGRWFGPAKRPLMGWLSSPWEGVGGSGVLILPDVGPQYWSAYQTLRAIAERLAAGGHTVLRLDYDGTGNSAGTQWDPDRLAAWRESALAGARELRALGCERLAVIGVRFGAAVALLDGSALGADEVVAWAPIHSGKRYVRGLRLLGEPLPDHAGMTSGGVDFTNATIAALGTLDPGTVACAPAPRTLVLGDVPADLVPHLASLGSDVECRIPEGSDQALDRPTEYAEVPPDVVNAVLSWLGAPRPVVAGLPRPEHSTHLTWDGETLEERVIDLGGLVGVLTEPTRPRPRPATVVFLNTGSDPHVGPGRAWVEYARSLGAAGHRAVRVDWSGWGESPAYGLAPGRPYAAHAHDEALAIVHALRAKGHDRIVLAGLCSSAWLALKVALEEPLAGVIALNPQMYWRSGDPVLSQDETHEWRSDARANDARWRRRGLWALLDVLGHRGTTARWLDGLASGDVPVLLLFSEGDDGLVHLRDRVGRRLRRAACSGMVRVEEVAGIDHGMLRTWRRPAMIRSLLDELDRLTP